MYMEWVYLNFSSINDIELLHEAIMRLKLLKSSRNVRIKITRRKKDGTPELTEIEVKGSVLHLLGKEDINQLLSYMEIHLNHLTKTISDEK